MLKSTFSDWLMAHDACSEARAFVGEKTLKQAWAQCNRPDRMFWLLNELNYSDDQTLRLYACWCAANTPLPDGRKTWDLLTDNRSRKAILMAIDYANGEATHQELAAAEAAAWYAAGAVAGNAAGNAARDAQANELRRRIPLSTVLELARKAGIKE